MASRSRRSSAPQKSVGYRLGAEARPDLSLPRQNRRPPCGIRHHPFEFPAQHPVVLGRKPAVRVGDQFGVNRNVRDEARGPGGHTLDDRYGEALVTGRTYDSPCPAVQCHQGRIGKMARHLEEAFPTTGCDGHRTECLGVVRRIIARDNQWYARPLLHRWRPSMGANDHIRVLPRILTAQHKQVARSFAHFCREHLELCVEWAAGDLDCASRHP